MSRTAANIVGSVVASLCLGLSDPARSMCVLDRFHRSAFTEENSKCCDLVFFMCIPYLGDETMVFKCIQS
jgi:hypothetical protein